MICSACRVEYPTSYAWCPRCGAALAVAPRGDWDPDSGLIEGTIVECEAPGGEASLGGADASGGTERPTIVQAATASTSLVVARSALPSLPARLWRQPAVRAVARASAGALALTLGMRLLRGALTRPRATGQLASSALPVLRQMFDTRAPVSRSPLTTPDMSGGEVVETFIYIRRVVRR